MTETSYVGAAERIYPVSKLVPLTTHLDLAGIPPGRALAGSGITPAALGDPYAMISRRQVVAVFENFLRLSPGAIGPLEIGASYQLTDYGFYGYALLSSATVRAAAHFGLVYHELATPVVELQLREEAEVALWDMQPLPDIAADMALRRFVLALQAGVMLALHRSISGDAFQLRSASFAHAAPADADGYRQVLNCPVEFGAERTELRFDTSWLDQRPIGANAITFQLVEDACRGMMDRIGHRRGIVGEIYRYLLSQSGRFATLNEMAATLGLHARTLRRKLISEDATYQAIVDEVRFKLAATYLTCTSMTHESISERLGFSDASSFRRAFKRWAQVSPNEFRQQQRMNEGTQR